MGWLLQHRKKDNKWRIWTTISDGWITDWLSEEEVKFEVAAHYERDHRLKLIEVYWTFPHGWTKKGTHKLFWGGELQKKKQEFLEWQLSILDNSKDYNKEISKKMKELGIPEFSL